MVYVLYIVHKFQKYIFIFHIIFRMITGTKMKTHPKLLKTRKEFNTNV